MHIEKYTIRNSLNNLCKVNAFCITSPQIKKVTIISISKEYLVSQLPPSLSKHRRLCWLLTVHLEKAMAPHSSTLAWKIPWTKEPGGLQSMGSLRFRYDWATLLSLSTFMHWRRKWQPIPVFLPGESQGRGAWWAAVSGVTQSRTQLKQLSSSSNTTF